ncbi:MAG: tryptophan synthase subunit alpha [Verrucomicrobiota bacterium]|nr:tryptophan synthase subunit alpha [Verrucomicrobiota bacterium]MDQ6939596.1 tryptophan synthase subunit alpha [Verrucomicrobiota bacterium]
MSRFPTRDRARFIPFIVAGDPNLKTTAALILALSELQPMAIEVGVPFSDPTADGPTIQRSGQRALRNGTTLAAILEMLKRTRGEERAPIVLFGYYNPILQFGLDQFVRASAQSKVSGVLVVDLPAEAARSLQKKLQNKNIDLIFLVTPTTGDKRLKQIVRMASGFIYVVARTGVTGTTRGLADESQQLVRRIRALTDLPVAVGFGITTGEQARRVCRYADAAVVGSRLVQEIEESRKLSSAQVVKRVLRLARQCAA